jgi:hypothetical protein
MADLGRNLIACLLRTWAQEIESGEIATLRKLNTKMEDFIAQHGTRVQLPEYFFLRDKFLD